MAKKAIKCSKMFDSTTGTVRENVVIYTDGERIEAVLPAAEAKFDGCEVIDLTGKFVTPGLCDCHMHLASNGEGSSMGTAPYQTCGDATLRAVNNVKSDLMAGFTAIRACGDHGFLDVAIRNAVDRGEIPGPRMMVSGCAISSTGGHADSHYNPYIEADAFMSGYAADGPAEMMKAVRYNIKHGADFIKYMSTGGVMSLGTTVGAQQMSFEEMKAICDTAKMYGMTIATHAHGTSGIKDAIRAGVTSVEHGMLMDEECMDMMAEHGTYLIPTIIAAHNIVVNGVASGIPAWAVEKAERCLENHYENLKKCMAKGVKIGFGTDTGTPFNRHGEQAFEFELMKKAGFTTEYILQAATRINAEMMKMDKQIGTIEAGKLADIVAFDASPMDDIKVMANCSFVMKDGVVYKG